MVTTKAYPLTLTQYMLIPPSQRTEEQSSYVEANYIPPAFGWLPQDSDIAQVKASRGILKLAAEVLCNRAQDSRSVADAEDALEMIDALKAAGIRSFAETCRDSMLYIRDYR